MFAYALENGYVGVYKQEKQLWQAKDPGKVVGLVQCSWEQDQQDAYKPLLVGRQDGAIEVRRNMNGQLVYKHQSYGAKLAGLIVGTTAVAYD